MNLKYYLRGLGIGIVVTAILMGVATKDNGQMTDAEIKERAAQLGMVENRVLADVSNDVSQQEQEEILPMTQPTVPPEVIGNIQEPESTTEPEAEKQPESTTEPKEETAESTGAQDAEGPSKEPEKTGEVIFLSIRGGETSWSVSKSLEEYGLIDDAAAFDKYLSRGGYDKSICVGEFEITMGATYEEIAKIITKKD